VQLLSHQPELGGIISTQDKSVKEKYQKKSIVRKASSKKLQSTGEKAVSGRCLPELIG
jgi:hypothetical protein